MSVFTAEVIAILEAIVYLQESNIACNYIIISDSKSAIDQTKNITFSSDINPIIVQIIKKLNTLKSKIVYGWGDTEKL